MQKLFLVTIALALVLCLGNTGQAQEIIPNNVIFSTDKISLAGGGKLHLASANTSVFAALDGYFAPAESNRFAGDSVNLSSINIDTSIRGGYPGLVNGSLYDRVYFTGELRFDGGIYVLPARYNRRKFTVTFPATVKGTLSGFTEPLQNLPTTPIFTSQLNMQGTVSLTLQVTGIVVNRDPTNPLPYYKIHRVEYSFSNTAQNTLQNQELSSGILN